MSLTSNQEQALLHLKENQGEKFFIGLCPEILEADFENINQQLLTSDEARSIKLRASENALFALCGFAPQ